MPHQSPPTASPITTGSDAEGAGITLPYQAIGHLETWLFDLDNTLYPGSSSLFPQIDARMKAFIANYLDLTPEDAFALQKRYYHQYGTSLRGLMIHHGLEPDAFLDYVHDIDHGLLDPDPALDEALAALPGRKLIFTNGSERHAEAVLDRLGLSRHFDGIFDVKMADFIPKPVIETYHKMLDHFGIEAQSSIFFEDSHLNLKPAAKLGMTTVLVRSGPDHAPLAMTPDTDLAHCDFITEDLTAWLQAAITALR
jgi:putative hydrolase of the HAD superfamily